MNDNKKYPICKRCNEPVIKNRDNYDTFEQMHWICFHLEYEHKGDPDEPCDDPACPQWQLKVFREKLGELGINPQSALDDAFGKYWNG